MIADALRQELVRLARAASGHAYCPYSSFPVGAALLTADDRLFTGCNVENASYGLTICAERCAVFQAVAAGVRQFRAIVIYTPTRVPSAPCGACRQVLNEFGADAIVMSVCDGADVVECRVAELLPHAFGPHNLGAPATS
jgi:cytidine deaminase